MDNLYVEGNHPDGVRAICKECETVVLKNTEHEAQKTVEQHNKNRHNGNEIAGVCAWDVQPLLTDEMPIGLKTQVIEATDDLSHEEQRKALGLVG